MNTNAIYPKIVFDYPETTAYYGDSLENLVHLMIGRQVPVVVWYKGRPLTRDELKKSKVKVNIIQDKMCNFKDKYTYERMNNGQIKITGEVTGAGIILNKDIWKKLGEEFGNYGIILFDDCSIWATKMQPEDAPWLKNNMECAKEKNINDNKIRYNKGKILFYGNKTELYLQTSPNEAHRVVTHEWRDRCKNQK